MVVQGNVPGAEFMSIDRLNELEDLMGPDGLAEIVAAYLEEAAAAVTEIGDMQGPAMQRERMAKLHYLSGASHNVGATAFARLCSRLEKNGASFGPIDYQAFCAEFQRVWAYLSARPGEEVRAAG